MKIWFLRFSLDDGFVSPAQFRREKLIPVLFREIPFKLCSLQLSEDELRELVNKCYDNSSPGKRGQFAGAMIRFFRDVQVGDVVAVCLNRNPDLFFGEVLKGALRQFPGIKDSKARPVTWLSHGEIKELEVDALPSKVKKYRGTICLWADANLRDEDEKKKETFYQKAKPGIGQIKFIRVGADFGCGGRLSRLFAKKYYHFIPIPKHNDPEFCRFTYGDVNHALKFRSLLNLRKDDVLVFYAGFDEEADKGRRRVVGIFAYFVIREVYLIDRRTKAQTAVKVANLPRGMNLIRDFEQSADKDVFKELIAYCGDYNEHAGAEECDSLQLVICGDRKKSRLLQQVEILADSNAAGKYILSRAVADRWALKPDADLTRCSVRTVASTQAERVKHELETLP